MTNNYEYYAYGADLPIMLYGQFKPVTTDEGKVVYSITQMRIVEDQGRQPIHLLHLETLPILVLEGFPTNAVDAPLDPMKYKPIYVVNFTWFCMEGGTSLVYREGQESVYGIKNKKDKDNKSDLPLEANDFPFSNFFEPLHSFNRVKTFTDNMFLRHVTLENISKKIQDGLKQTKGVRPLVVTCQIDPSIWQNDICPLFHLDQEVEENRPRRVLVHNDEAARRLTQSAIIRSFHCNDITVLFGLLGKDFHWFPLVGASVVDAVRLSCLLVFI